MSDKKVFEWRAVWRSCIISIAVILLIVIYLWPQKIGDIRTGQNGNIEIYYRGPDPRVSGRWLQQTGEPKYLADFNQHLAASGNYVIAGKKVVDCVPVKGMRYMVVFDDGTAAILTGQSSKK
jgi:hypothetical protein